MFAKVSLSSVSSIPGLLSPGRGRRPSRLETESERPPERRFPLTNNADERPHEIPVRLKPSSAVRLHHQNSESEYPQADANERFKALTFPSTRSLISFGCAEIQVQGGSDCLWFIGDTAVLSAEPMQENHPSQDAPLLHIQSCAANTWVLNCLAVVSTACQTLGSTEWEHLIHQDHTVRRGGYSRRAIRVMPSPIADKGTSSPISPQIMASRIVLYALQLGSMTCSASKSSCPCCVSIPPNVLPSLSVKKCRSLVSPCPSIPCLCCPSTF